MRYRLLGRTGLYVSDLCLGTMTFGDQGWGKVMGALDEVSALPPDYPGWMLGHQGESRAQSPVKA